MKEHLNKAELKALVIHAEAGKTTEEMSLLLNLEPASVEKYVASFCPKPEPKPKRKRKKKTAKDE